MRSVLHMLAVGCAALPAIGLAALPASASVTPPCTRQLSIAGPGVLVSEGSDLEIPVVDLASCHAAGSYTVLAEPVQGPNGEPPTDNDNDYDGNVHTVPWPAAASSQRSVPIAVHPDNVPDGNEYFQVRIAAVGGRAQIAPGGSTRMVRIGVGPDEEPVYTGADDYGCMIGACTLQFMTMDLVTQPVEISWRTYDLTAKAGLDYQRVRFGKTVIPAGGRSATIHVSLLPGARAGRHFGVQITGVRGGTIGGRASSIMTIAG